MTVSYTKLSRYIDNPARAYAHYVKNEENVYPIDNQEALVYGRIVHGLMSGDKEELSDEEVKVAFKYGNKERGLKASFDTADNVAMSMVESLQELYESLGIKRKISVPDLVYNKDIKSEVPFENDTFNGRFDFVDYNNKIIIDWKTVSPRTDFDKAWSEYDSTYTSWIHSTSYDLQAYIYLYSIIELTKKVGWRYYVIAATKEYAPRTRVIDMTSVTQSFYIGDEIEQALDDIEAYEDGTKKPELLNDKSRWYEEHKPFEVEEW